MDVNFYDAMNDVLGRRRYDRLMGRNWSPWETIDNALDALPSPPPVQMNRTMGIAPLGTIFILVGSVIVLVVIIVLVLNYLNNRVVKEYDLSDIFEELAQRNYTVQELIHLSQTAKDKRLAIRYRYIAALLSLNERDIINISPSATNATILRELKDSPFSSLSSAFSHTVDVFHLSWFGFKDITDQGFFDFANSVNTLIAGGEKIEAV